MWLPFISAAAGAVTVGPPARHAQPSAQSVVARVGGRRLWFASADAPLAASAEAFGTALLVPALHAGRPLALRTPACPIWVGNLAPLTAAFRDLWYPTAAAPRLVAGSGAAAAAAGTALCFSGGVDAFHALLAGGRPVDTLVSVAGYPKLRTWERKARGSRESGVKVFTTFARGCRAV